MEDSRGAGGLEEHWGKLPAVGGDDVPQERRGRLEERASSPAQGRSQTTTSAGQGTSPATRCSWILSVSGDS